jgi:hypothetical protein
MNAGSLLGRNYNWEEGPPYIDIMRHFDSRGARGILAGCAALHE